MHAALHLPALPGLSRRLVLTLGAALAAGCLTGALLVTGVQATGHLVSQKGRAFQPGSLTIQRGETVVIVNDDSDLLHHLYVESDAFSYDSGDQVPGSRTAVTFPQTGMFQVLCGIHPKMKLNVRVN
ncbi:plastocyanin [Methylobacterium durans]|uniref:plastocyanin n=1 Tax=Methylobacterium durans TaxID=2202825 RepID=UPI002AFF17F0|nr:plastocyanin [Methylobacterium durans]MEA1832485.1 plastocyanin [Methylobacterium durans]